MIVKNSLCDVEGDILNNYSCTLNQTDLTKNKNKFYIIQLLKSSASYIVFIRYGRIGENGTITYKTFSDSASGEKYFCEQFKKKTGNIFNSQFIKKQGKYFLTELETPELDEKSDISENDEDLDDNMDEEIKYLINLISNEDMLSNTLVCLNIDPKKLPLGKISKKQLDKAKEILLELKNIVKTDNAKIESEILDNITELSSEYYTYVPSSTKRNVAPPLLNNIEIIDKHLELIDELTNIHMTYTIIKKNKSRVNKLTNIYNELCTSIKPLQKTKKIYKELVKYIENSHGTTHKCKLDILNIYEIIKDTDNLYDKYTKNMENKTLLFHGSQLSNWCSILKNGLFLDPSKLGVPITGKMFGYGIYWANSITKSFNYCNSDNTNNFGVLAIAEVALGEMHEQFKGDSKLSHEKLKKIKKNSTWGIGEKGPSSTTIIDNIIIPNGKITKKTEKNITYSLKYDEFIIYNTNQYKIKYLIVVKNII
jgi:poly [ADP-ribose] polymerase